jgi:DNA modification methylase
MNELSLSANEQADLERCEAVIERGLATFVEVGSALVEVRDRRLYRKEYASFEAYCRDRWGMVRRHADRMIEAAAVAENLRPIGLTLGCESQARALAPLDPDAQRAAMGLAVEAAGGGRLTASHVRQAVADLSLQNGSPAAGSAPAPVRPDPPLIGGPACRLLPGDARQALATLDIEPLHACVTSPAYFGQRDYGHPDQIGREKTPKAYLAALAEVFHEVARVMRPDGTMFVVMGDTYHRGSKLGLPDRLAQLLKRDGWRWRGSIIAAKAIMMGEELRGSCMPGSQRDRCTSAYEVVLHMDRGRGSFFDGLGQRSSSGAMYRDVWFINTEPSPLPHFALMATELARRLIRLGTSEGCCPRCGSPWHRLVEKERKPTRPGVDSKVYIDPPNSPYERHSGSVIGNRDPRRHTTVITPVGWQPGCECGLDEVVPATVVDPFGGLATTGLVAAELGRSSIMIELNPAYVEQARLRLEAAGIIPIIG